MKEKILIIVLGAVIGFIFGLIFNPNLDVGVKILGEKGQYQYVEYQGKIMLLVEPMLWNGPANGTSGQELD